MTIPYIPGFGDIIAAGAPRFGRAIRDIIDPNFELVQNMKAVIARNPELLNALASVSATSPGVLESVFGKDVFNRLGLGALQEDPQSALARNIASAGLALPQSDISDAARVKVGLPTQTESAITKNRLRLSDEQIAEIDRRKAALDKLKVERPDIYKLAEEAGAVEALGSSLDSIRKEMNARKAEELLKRFTPRELAAGFVSGGIKAKNLQTGEQEVVPITSEVIEGMFAANPNAAREIFDALKFEREAGLRLRLAAMAKESGRLDFLQQLFKESATIANKLGVKPLAMFAANYGKDSLEEIRGLVGKESITDEDIEKARRAATIAFSIQAGKGSAQLRAAAETLVRAVKTGKKEAKQAAITSFNAAAKDAGIDAAADADGNIYIGGQKVDSRSFIAKFFDINEPIPNPSTISNPFELSESAPSKGIQELVNKTKPINPRNKAMADELIRNGVSVNDLKANPTFLALPKSVRDEVIAYMEGKK